MDLLFNPIRFRVDTIPVAQPRPRAVSFGGHARVYEAKKSHPIHLFKASVQLAAKQAYNGPLLDVPIRLSALFVMPRPKTMTYKKKPNPRYWHASRPDVDNLLKGMVDALSGIIFADDNVVSEVRIRKVVASAYESPYVEIEIDVLGEYIDLGSTAINRSEYA